MVEWIQSGGTLLIFSGSLFFVLLIWSLNQLLRSFPSPVNKMMVRWIRLLCISLFIGLLLKWIALESVPYWRLALIGFLFWAMAESLYAWVYILAWDKSEFPLFPELQKVDEVDWPANRRFFFIRDWIREHKYEFIGGFKFVHMGESLQQVAVYGSPDRLNVLQVMIIPDATGVIMDQISFSSQTEEGERIITDNTFMPYGGAYPTNWNVARFPITRKITLLQKKHENRRSRKEETLKAFDEDILDWVEDAQKELETINVEKGLLNERRDRREFGKMTGEGRYRIWIEFLMLNYFGKSMIG